MITETQSFPIKFPKQLLPNTTPEETLFFDIETTGFSPKSSSLYLIGAGCYHNDTVTITQWMTEQKDEEPLLLKAFADYCKNFSCLVHFNGQRFDIPYLRGKYAAFSIPFPLDFPSSLDLYLEIRPLKKYLKLERLNQKTLEAFLNIQRADTFDGGALIPLYREFLLSHEPRLKKLLLLHNYEDVKGMFEILPILSYKALQHGDFIVENAEYMEESHSFQLLLTLGLPFTLPLEISCKLSHGYMTAKDKVCKLLISGYIGTLKYYFPNYKNYYYLPGEDTAIHKSVAGYVDKAYREQAKAATCYIKKNSQYLPQADSCFTPAFKKEYPNKLSYFEYTDTFLIDIENLHMYAQKCLFYV